MLPASASPTAARLLVSRALRGFADGFTSVLLAAYLKELGFSATQVGALVTATLLGSAALTLAVGLLGGRLRPRNLLLAGTALMLATAAGFASLSEFWPLLLIAFAGTLNPSAGDVTLFLPIEQSLLAESGAAEHRTALFARYNLGGALLGALGALSSGAPDLVARALGWPRLDALRAGFLVYAIVALALAALYLRLPLARAHAAAGRPLAQSRGVVLRLAALFSLDSFGGGFVVDSILALWLFERFALPLPVAGAVFFSTGLLAASSQLVSPWLAARIGLIRTMVFTHLPANAFLLLAGFMPSAPLAIACLLARMALAQMDVPARQSYVMAVVPPEERAAAASVTNVPRSLATAAAPVLAGLLLDASSGGWPLVVGGSLKITYDLLLLAAFRRADRRH